MRSRHLILLLPGLLGASARDPDTAAEAAGAMDAADLRGLRTLLSRADPQRGGAGESPESLLFGSLGVSRGDGDWPSAAASAAADGATSRPQGWMRADPVHLEAGNADLHLRDPRDLDPSPEESLELCTAINAALDGVPGRIEALAPARWYIGLDRVPRLSTVEPSLAAGGPVGPVLPRGPDAGIWLRALTEIQMLLHDLPVNRAREARGRPSVNSVWLWGAGPPPPRPAVPPVRCLWSDSATARGLGHLLGVPCRPLPAGAGALLEGWPEEEEGRDLVYSESLHYASRLGDWSAWLEGLARWDALWFEPLWRALGSGMLARLRIESGGGICHDVSASARWRWWRRARPLPAFFPGGAPSRAAVGAGRREGKERGALRVVHRHGAREGRRGDS